MPPVESEIRSGNSPNKLYDSMATPLMESNVAENDSMIKISHK